MKKFLQIVAVMVVALLAAQPTLAGLTCQMTVLPSAPDGPRCHMAVNCPMGHHGAGANCLQDCCRYPLPQAVVQSWQKARPKTAGTQFAMAIPAISLSAHPILSPPPQGDLVAASPPRTILFKVFRI